MCGLAGLLTSRPGVRGDLDQVAARMTRTLAHRGPDDEGIWTDIDSGIALGFRRLAIIDLSAHGHQPMASRSGRYTMVFNGEIYNHGDIRRELGDSVAYRGHSDTETALAAIERWGVAGAVGRFVGMFAIAVWDAEERSLFLLRDRLGIKPMFVAWQPGHIAFGSELKALFAAPGIDTALDPSAVAAYLRYLYVPAPTSILRGVRKLPPGHMAVYRLDDREPPESVAYWSVADVVDRGYAARTVRDDAEMLDELESLMSDAVRLRLQADVPVGALLSGGIDSSVVSALAQKQLSRPLKTYCIGFDVADFSEAEAARRVAAHLGTDHSEMMVTASDALELVPRLPEMFDEPLANASQIPTYLVCAMARREVTVALSGDGGDETLGGYNRYVKGAVLIERLQRVPGSLRHVAAGGVSLLAGAGRGRVYQTVRPMLPGYMQRAAHDRIQKVAALMRTDTTANMYRSLLSSTQSPLELMQPFGAGTEWSSVDAALDRFKGLPLLERMMATDQTTYLADDLLAKVDRASMAVSLELRVPLLDHRLVEFTWRTPSSFKVRDGQGKWPLRQVLYRHVPRELVDRPKMGFTVPIAAWLRGPLAPWANDLLASQRTGDDLLDRDAVDRTWRAFNNGESRLADGLWAVLQLLAWRDHWKV